MDDDVDFTACRFDFRIDDKNGLTPARRKKSERRPVNYNTLFKCKVCGNLFESRPALLAHKLEHTAFKCGVCGDSFQRKSIWRLHMSKVHGINMADSKRKEEEAAAQQINAEAAPPLMVPPPTLATQTNMPPAVSYPNMPGFVCINVPIFISSGEGSSTTVTAMPPGSQPPCSMPLPPSSAAAAAAQGMMPFPSPPVPPLLPPPAPFSIERKSSLEPGEVKKPFTAPTPTMGYPMSKPMTTSSLAHITPINRDLHRGPPSFAQAFKNFNKTPQKSPTPELKKKKEADDAQVDNLVIDLSVKAKRKVHSRDDGSCSDYDDDKLAMQDQYKEEGAPAKKKKVAGGGLSKMVEKLWQNRILHQKNTDLVASSPPAVHSRAKSVPRSLSSSPAPAIVSPCPSEDMHVPNFSSVVENAMKRCRSDFTTQESPSPIIEVAPPPRPRSPQVEDLYDVGGPKTNFCTLKFHTCPTCRQLFSNSEEMRKHQREQHSNKRVRNRGPRNRKRMHCPSCSFISTSAFRLKHHQVTVHPDHLGINELASMPKEPESKLPTRIKCRFPGCNRVFRELRQLRVHQTLHTCEKPLLCELCDYSCRHKSSLVWHMKTKHVDATEQAEIKTEVKTEVKTEPPHVKQEFPTEDFKEPYSPHAKPEKSSKQGELSVYRIEASPGPDPQYFTSVMKFNFTKTPATSSSAEEGRQKCTCKTCAESFDNAEEMWQHKMERHQDSLQFLCDSCEFRTPSRLELQSHMLCTHGNEVGDMKEYLCFICSKGYSSKRGLNNHLMRHSEEGPPGYDCQLPGCKSRLVSKSALRNHVRRVHAKKPSTATATSPVTPVDVASEALMYCDFEGCDKAFKEAKHLKVHRMQHTDERPLKCELCFYSCRQRNSMNWHMKSKHGMDKHVTPDGRTIYLATGGGTSDPHDLL